MFKETLKVIWDKLIKEQALSAWEWLVLWMNKIGLFGTGYAVVAIYWWIKYISNGVDFNLLIAAIFTTLFAQINIAFFAMVWQEHFHKLFPKGIVLPFIDKTIK